MHLRRRQILLDFDGAFPRFTDMTGETFEAFGLGVDQPFGLLKPFRKQAVIVFAAPLHFGPRGVKGGFVLFQPAQHRFDGMGDAAHGGGRSRFRGFHARTERFQGAGDAAEIAGGGLVTRFLSGVAVAIDRTLSKDRFAAQIM